MTTTTNNKDKQGVNIPGSNSSSCSTTSAEKSPTSTASTSTSSPTFWENSKKNIPWDWPDPKGPIDLQIHDLPHLSSSTEWWYINAHLEGEVETKKNKHNKKKSNKSGTTKEDDDDEGHPGFSVFASFFRSFYEHDSTTGEYVFVHSMTWALMDHKTKKYYNVSLLDPTMPKMWLKALEHENHDKHMPDPRIKKATKEMLQKGKVPYPDRLLKENPKILHQDLSRLPAKDANGNNHKEDVLKKAFENAKNNQTNKPSSCCCFRRSSVLNTVASSTLPNLSLDFDGNKFTKRSDGSYELILQDNDVHQVQVKLRLVPQTQAIRNGLDGILDGKGEIPDFFYYSLPHCTVTGTVTLPDIEQEDRHNAKIQRKSFFIIDGPEEEEEEEQTKEPIQTYTTKVTGKGWYDHQFGCVTDKPTNNASDDSSAEEGVVVGATNQTVPNGSLTDQAPINIKSPSYTWCSLQLDNGYQICSAEWFLHDDSDPNSWENDKPMYYLVLVDAKGQRHQIHDFSLTSTGEHWVSMTTFRDYPVNWKLTVPSWNIHLDLKAAFDQQEFVTVASKNPFWEGSIKVTGVFGTNKAITGKGVIERTGFCPTESLTLEHFFKNVSRETLKSVQKILPFNPEGDKLNELVSNKENTHYTEHLDSVQFSKALVEPIRSVLDRGGKSWRSYAALACCDMVGGNSQHCQDWLALPELMHVGSLIVDDVEDRSTIRRGGPSCHVLYGEDVAINAGCMAYFLGQIAIYEGDGDPQQKVEIYNLYFETMRAAHSGQAMDIHGLNYMMDDVVQNGGDLCLQRVIAIHRLKSAIPASSMASMGCKLGGGSKLQSKALSGYFETLGIAFQIVDDVLNLRGFINGLKTRGEDITAGKVTYPVAKAMSKLEKEDRAKLWEIVKSKPEDIETIREAIDLIDKVDAIGGSYEEAKEMMEEAWRKLDPVIVDSIVKLNLRAFGWYVLDRVY